MNNTVNVTLYSADYSWPGTRSSPSYRSPPARPSCSTWRPRCLYWPDTPRLRSSDTLSKIKYTQLTYTQYKGGNSSNHLQNCYENIIIISKLDLNLKFNASHMTYHELWPGSRQPFPAPDCASADLQARQTPLADLAHCVASSLL